MNVLYEKLIRPVQDEMINKIILENLLTKGKVTIEEAKFANELVENVLIKLFANDLKTLEETLIYANQQPMIENQTNVKPEINSEKTELNENDYINLFLKKSK
jgi:hypothetical protein